MKIIVGLLCPDTAGHLFPGEEVRPGALRQIEGTDTLVVEDRRYQQVITQHILFIQIPAVAVPGEFQYHTAHSRHTGTGGIDRGLVQIRHEGSLQPGKGSYYVHCLFVIQPRYAVRLAAMQAAVGRQKPESHPALVYICRRGVLEAADVMCPEAETGHQEGQAAAKAFFHGYIVGPAVAAPVYWEFLAAHGSGTGEEHGFAFAAFALQQVVDCLVI